MSPVVRLVVAAAVGAAGVLLVLDGWRGRRPPIGVLLERLAGSPPGRGRRVADLFVGVRMSDEVSADLRLVGRTSEQHALLLAVAACLGAAVPLLIMISSAAAGAWSPGPIMVVFLASVGLAVAPLTVHSTMRTGAAAIRGDLRHQLSAYLDVVTMLLAANVGNEGALRQAAERGDGRLFVELRRRMLAAEAASRSSVHALAQLGDDLELVELQQIAASAALGASSGAPVARTLASKCASLRHALSSEQEAAARVRAGKITIPLVGMSLLIMTAVIYPALQFHT